MKVPIRTILIALFPSFCLVSIAGADWINIAVKALTRISHQPTDDSGAWSDWLTATRSSICKN